MPNKKPKEIKKLKKSKYRRIKAWAVTTQSGVIIEVGHGYRPEVGSLAISNSKIEAKRCIKFHIGKNGVKVVPVTIIVPPKLGVAE